MVKENKNHYYPSARKIDLTILMDIPWWDIIQSESQTLSELTKEWYLEFQNGYEILIEREVPTSQTYKQGSQSLMKSENNDNEELK